MTELETLKAEYAALGARIEKLEAAEKPWPQVGDDYSFMISDGDIYTGRFCGDGSDAARKSIGNVFRTRQEAVDERDRRKVLAIMREMADGGVWSIKAEFFGVEPNLHIGEFSYHSLFDVTFSTHAKAVECRTCLIEKFSLVRLLELWGVA